MTLQPTRVPLYMHVAVLTVSVQEHSVNIFITATKAVSRSCLRGRQGGFPKLLNTTKPSGVVYWVHLVVVYVIVKEFSCVIALSSYRRLRGSPPPLGKEKTEAQRS